ncbi:SDR family NAD(P)-dependent oxidoreductase [Hydrogenophaga sp. BPS33]|uniref:SDR family NAD(P)-dependent oxidoreductase n=1 Tax=Hydrogenophaga sp. BPS33 TaxID=2651974 RepID=UPI0013202F3B|nr:SDR family NAD(P)-dependent oxidoreductase [Hydrogenophaga sp. BPS33]QHE84458.1 SDR family oxidoreductase [Hydrogenophaga sp. BPS33]
MNITSTSAVVTGGASGLGAATARLLAARGARVAIFDQDVAGGEKLAADIGGIFCAVDITSQAQVEAAFDKSRAAHGQERILVNCAGIGGPNKTVSRDKDTGEIRPLAVERFERVIQVNLIGTFRAVSLSAAGMFAAPVTDADADGERGVIINTASIAAQDGQMGQVPYSASKAGVAGMTLPLARDFMAEGIRVNTILPGIFDTPMLARAAPHVRAALAASVPFPRRLGDADEYAAVVAMLVTTRYMNGECIRLDGGLRMAPR